MIPNRLDKWLENRIKRQGWSLDQLSAYQLARLNQTLCHVRENSPFYRRRLKEGTGCPLTDLSQTRTLPFTTAADLSRHHLDMLCVSHGDVARVVTLQTSGTSSAPKRLYFTEADLELSIDFFHHGMRCLVRPGQQVLIMLPGKTPDSVGDLLRRGLARIPAAGHIHWPVLDLEQILKSIADLRIDCLVGAPAQIFALCRHDDGRRLNPNPLKRILLSTDYVPKVVVEEIGKVWGCAVFEHYGMTEMGLGGGLHCATHRGYLLREADLLIEIVDPGSGKPLPTGVTGEVVFTTLTRQAMPLIRYRTGDLASWLQSPCGCGSMLRHLGKVCGRLADRFQISAPLCMPALDEVILARPGIYSFQAAFRTEDDRRHLDLTLFCAKATSAMLTTDVRAALAPMLATGTSPVDQISIHTQPPEALRWDATGMVKRTIASI